MLKTLTAPIIHHTLTKIHRIVIEKLFLISENHTHLHLIIHLGNRYNVLHYHTYLRRYYIVLYLLHLFTHTRTLACYSNQLLILENIKLFNLYYWISYFSNKWHFKHMSFEHKTFEQVTYSFKMSRALSVLWIVSSIANATAVLIGVCQRLK